MKTDKLNQNKNGLELILSAQLTIELMEQYKMHGLQKKYGNMFLKSIEKQICGYFDGVYEKDPEFTTNAMNIKHELISTIALMNEADVMLFAEHTKKFVDNIEEHRINGEIFFTEIK